MTPEQLLTDEELRKVNQILDEMHQARLHNPRNTFQINHIWAFLSVDEGGEGVCAGPLLGKGTVIPLIAADEKRLAILRPFAQELAKVFGKPIKLVRFSLREEIEEFKP